MKEITSLQNNQVKRWRKLLSKKGRQTYKTFLIEGIHLVEEAAHSENVEIRCLIGTEEMRPTIEKLNVDVPIYLVNEKIVKEISDTETSQEIFAEVKNLSSEELPSIEAPFLFLDAVQDPGNVGTLIRTAAACGFEGVVLGKGTADAYNPKTLRSAQGSTFHIRLFEGDLLQWIHHFKKQNVPVYGTALHSEAVEYQNVPSSDKFALIVGNEGSGVASDILDAVDKSLYIPIRGGAESLNVGIAAAVLMYHLYLPNSEE